MKKKVTLPMPPLDQLPYEDIKKEWHTLTFDRYIVRTAQLYWESWSQTGKIWTSFRFNNNAWIAVEKTYSWIIMPNHTLDKRWTKDLPEEIQNSEEGQIYEGYRTFIMPEYDGDDKFTHEFDTGEHDVFPTSNLLFSIYAHESFHAFQSEFNIPEELPSISTPDIPPILEKSPEARKIRLELFRNIHSAILNYEEEEETLQIAKYWLNRYYSECKEEANLLHRSDIMEGSARYFEIAITVRSLFGFEISDKQIDNAYRQLVESYYTIERVKEDPTYEIYDLPGLAGLLLERRKIEGWQERVANGERIQDILLEFVEPIEPNENK